MKIEDYIKTELKKNIEAFSIYEALPVSHKKEYQDWITSAKKEETKARRLQKMITMLIEKNK